jgi:hypothetical protein
VAQRRAVIPGRLVDVDERLVLQGMAVVEGHEPDVFDKTRCLVMYE